MKAPNFGNYVDAPSFTLPFPGNTFPVFDVLSDGRIVATNGDTVVIENAVSSRSFVLLKTIGEGYAAFIRVSPSSDTIAIGLTGRVLVFPLSNVALEQSFNISNYDAEWLDNNRLAVSFSGVNVINISAGTVHPVIAGVGGAPAGVTIDNQGNLYTGNGWDTSAQPSETGWIKRFVNSDWENAYSTGTAIQFEVSGNLVVDLLSAAYLGFESSGHLMVGGGDSTVGDAGYAALVHAQAIANAISSGIPVNQAAPTSELHKFDPDAAPNNFYFLGFNSTLNELYISDFNNALVYTCKKELPGGCLPAIFSKFRNS